MSLTYEELKPIQHLRYVLQTDTRLGVRMYKVDDVEAALKRNGLRVTREKVRGPPGLPAYTDAAAAAEKRLQRARFGVYLELEVTIGPLVCDSSGVWLITSRGIQDIRGKDGPWCEYWRQVALPAIRAVEVACDAQFALFRRYEEEERERERLYAEFHARQRAAEERGEREAMEAVFRKKKRWWPF
ncbi:MAG: hypothetical protein H3C62_01960 [Gemmatimonadaceae bacterium]|nr:hypothetical protein [Gemmatimonadaceae bacterium]